MDRRESILKYITKQQRGIEIGAWFSPLAAKRDGYQCLTLDVVDATTSRERAFDNPAIPTGAEDNIEEVDLLGSSTHIYEMVEARGELGAFDYIVSSHNFEHIPNPIRFLQGCGKVLKPGGVISMAVPDHRACFDYFRPVTRLSEWIQAHLDDRGSPTLAQVFDSGMSHATYNDDGKLKESFGVGVEAGKVTAIFNLDPVFNQWMNQIRDNVTEYQDAHCSVFTPASFELLIRDSAYLGLTPFEVVEISEPAGNEFHVHLRLPLDPLALRPSSYEQLRNLVLQRVVEDAAAASSTATKSKDEVIARLDEQARFVETKARAFQQECIQLQEAIQAMERSSSWRITAPIRRAVTALRKSRSLGKT